MYQRKTKQQLNLIKKDLRSTKKGEVMEISDGLDKVPKEKKKKQSGAWKKNNTGSTYLGNNEQIKKVNYPPCPAMIRMAKKMRIDDEKEREAKERRQKKLWKLMKQKEEEKKEKARLKKKLEKERKRKLKEKLEREKKEKEKNDFIEMLRKQKEQTENLKEEGERMKHEKQKISREKREKEERDRKLKIEEKKVKSNNNKKKNQKKVEEDEDDFDDFIDELDLSDDEDNEALDHQLVKEEEAVDNNNGNKTEKKKVPESKNENVTSSKSSKKDRKSKTDGLRSPICCVLGHVNTGKTKILDCIRNTKVQDGESGGITQQIGATYIPVKSIKERTCSLTKKMKKRMKFKVPGLLIIDTPGHGAFTNLRSRGSSLCDIAILIVDIMHGIEEQTIESIHLLRKRKRPFVVALNKVDQLNDWKANDDLPIQETLKLQKKHTIRHFNERVKQCITNFQEQGLNSCLYYKNKDFKKYISLVPTSAISGEGIPDLLTLMTQLTQKLMVKRITYKSKLQCTILESKFVLGHGHTIDVILSNGVLRSSDTIVVCTLNGAVVTPIRALLTPKPMKEIRVKSCEWVKNDFVRASQGIKISAPRLEGAVSGTPVFVVNKGGGRRNEEEIEELKEKVMEDYDKIMRRIHTSGKGCHVQASTLGSLEALLDELKSNDVPVSGCSIGNIHKKDVTHSASMIEQMCPEYAVILAFDVKTTKDADLEARKVGVKIFHADIIYHLVKLWDQHMTRILQEKKEKMKKKEEIIWPCILRIRKLDIFRTSKPCIIGVDVIKGLLKTKTPICALIRTKSNCDDDDEMKIVELGRVEHIQYQKTSLLEAEEGTSVSIQFASKGNVVYGKHFFEMNQIVSKISRRSIDALKENYKEELEKSDQKLLKVLVEVKRNLNIL